MRRNRWVYGARGEEKSYMEAAAEERDRRYEPPVRPLTPEEAQDFRPWVAGCDKPLQGPLERP